MSHAGGHPCCCGCSGGSAVGALQYVSRMSVLFCSQTSRSHLRVLILLFSSRRRSTIRFLSSFRGSGTSAGKDEADMRLVVEKVRDFGVDLLVLCASVER